MVPQTKWSLKSIVESRLGNTVAEAERNLKRQAGFSAEQIEVTRRNKQAILKDKSIRSLRLDDLGKTNDQLVEIAGSGYQMKFIGENGRESLPDLCRPPGNLQCR